MQHEGHHADVNPFCLHSHWLLEHHSASQVLETHLSQIHSQCKDGCLGPAAVSLTKGLCFLRGFFFPLSLTSPASDMAGLKHQATKHQDRCTRGKSVLKSGRQQFGHTQGPGDTSPIFLLKQSSQWFGLRFSPDKAGRAALRWP